MTSCTPRAMTVPSSYGTYNDRFYTNLQKPSKNKSGGGFSVEKSPAISIYGDGNVGPQAWPEPVLQRAKTLKLEEVVTERSMGDVLRRVREMRSEEIARTITRLGFDKPSQRLFDQLADNDPELLIDVVQYYRMSKVNLAYALAAFEHTAPDRLDARAFRIISGKLYDPKGFVREGAAYALKAFKGTEYASEAVELLDSVIENERFDSVRRALSGTRNNLTH